jgi:two-component sensor histidine kinase
MLKFVYLRTFMLKFITFFIIGNFLLPITGIAQQSMSAGELMSRLHHSAKDTARVKVLLRLGDHYTYEIPEDFDKTHFKTALRFFLMAKDLSLEVHSDKYYCQSLQSIGDYFLFINQPDSAAPFYDKLLSYYRQKRDYQKEASTLANIGNAHKSLEDKVRYYRSALQIYKQNGLKEEEAICLKTIADFHLRSGKLSLSEQELMQVLKIQKEIKSKKIVYTYDLFAGLYSQYDLHKALLNAQKTLDAVKETGDSTHLDFFYNRISSIYFSMNNSSKALEYALYEHKHILNTLAGKMPGEPDEFKLYDDLRALNGAYYNIKNTREPYRLIKETEKKYPPKFSASKSTYYYCLADYYNAVNNTRLAEINYQKVINYANQKNDHNEILWAYFAITDFYMKHKMLNKAAPYLDFLYSSVKSLNFPLNQQTYFFKFQADSAKGNWKNAFFSHKAMEIIRDSVYSQIKMREFRELELKYQTSKQQEKILDLQKRSDLQQTIIKKEKIGRWFTIIIILLLIIVIGLLYYSYYLKHKNNISLISQKDKIDQQNVELKVMVDMQLKLINEKEWLMKELHHRVKNNLQIITSLLNIQSNYLEDDKALNAVRDTQNRIHSMSLIHQKLYQIDKVTKINISEFINELVGYLKTSLGAPQSIDFQVFVSPIELDVTHAIPLGLIITEFITNAVKYAFPNGETGNVKITLVKVDNQVSVTISDDGVGIGNYKMLSDTKSLGLTLIQTFCDQLDASLEIVRDKGLSMLINFKLENSTAPLHI